MAKQLALFQTKKPSFLLFIIFLMNVVVLSAQVDLEHGEKLYKANCASCHKIDKKLIGPALQGVTEKRSQEWLIKWIRNNVELRASGDQDAIQIFEEYNGSLMNVYPQFSDDDILSILAYVDNAAVEIASSQSNVKQLVGEEVMESDNTFKLLIIALVLLVVTSLLAKIKNTLKHTQGQETTTLIEDAGGYFQIVTKNKKIVTLTVILLAVFVVNGAWNFLIGIGVSQGYQPVQPIAFSHEIHAGENGIDCNYCHSSARHSKTAGIPSVNVCMNCHTYIQEGPITGTKEIQKIYDAIGFDPKTGEYIEGYNQQTIKWVKVHNLPDLAYFNHSQHVNVAGVECQTCHGPVEEMEEVYQFAELTMNWCIDCHRTTEIKTLENPYYEELHEDLIEKYHGQTITVDKIGGLECGKCHY